MLQRLVENGLRAQLRTGNLLTGQLYVALDFVGKPGAHARAMVIDGVIRLPTVPGALSEVQPQLAAIVQKLSKVPFDEIGTNLQATLTSVQSTFKTVQDTLASAGTAIAQLTPEAQKALAEVQRTLLRAQASLESLDRNITDPNAPMQRGVGDTLQELQRVSRIDARVVRLSATASRGLAARQAGRPGAATHRDEAMNRPSGIDTGQIGVRRRALQRGLAALVLACAGCAAPPAVHLHTLMPVDRPTPAEGVPLDGRGPAIVLDPIGVPAQVDQPQWLIRLPDDTLALLEQERWASPLSDEFGSGAARDADLALRRRRGPSGGARSAGVAHSRRDHALRFDAGRGAARKHLDAWRRAAATARGAALPVPGSARRAAAGMPALAEAHRRKVARLGDGDRRAVARAAARRRRPLPVLEGGRHTVAPVRPRGASRPVVGAFLPSHRPLLTLLSGRCRCGRSARRITL